MYTGGNSSNYSLVLERFKGLSVEELKTAVNNDFKFDEVVKNGLQYQSFNEEKRQIVNDTKSIAEVNYSKAEEIKLLKEDIVRLTSVIKSYDIESKLDQIRSVLGFELTPESILAKLQLLATETEAECEQTFQSFLNNELDLESFLDTFMTKRELMYNRKIKSEQLSQILKKITTAYQPYPSFRYDYRDDTNILPYPTNSGVIPMPLPSSFFNLQKQRCSNEVLT